MNTDHEDNLPLVSILMAVYKPHPVWLKEQLGSLNRQTYRNLEIMICDDCPEDYADKRIFDECLTSFPYTLVRNEQNLGSNGTFEKLAGLARGEYICFCDQDDIWEDNKTERLVLAAQSTVVSVACADMNIIDGGGKLVAVGMKEVRKRHRFLSGEGQDLARRLLFKNFVTGCNMIVRREDLLGWLPFCPYMVWDNWIAVCAAQKGGILSIDERLINYRMHDDNQTATMRGINGKRDYIPVRIDRQAQMLLWMKARAEDGQFAESVDEALKWTRARKRFYGKNPFAVFTVWRYRAFNPPTVWFELATAFLPNFVFMRLVKGLRENKL